MHTDRTAVLIHGCHLQASLNGKTWEQIVFGDSEGATLEGRAVMGIKAALDQRAELVIFSTGASERDGVKEGEFTLRTALLRAERVSDATGYREEAVLRLLRHRTHLDLESQDTRSECELNFRRCASMGIGRVILVSSAWHIQRCHTEALKVAETMRAAGMTVPDIVAVASHGSTEDIVVLEPPHRGDRPKTEFHLLGRRFFRIVPERLKAFQQELSDLLTKHGA